METRTGSDENPEKSQIANTRNSQFVYDSPGMSITGVPKVTLNGRYDVAFSLSEKNTKTGQVSAKQFYYRVTLAFVKGKLVGYQAIPVSQNEFEKLTGQDKKKEKKKKKEEK